MGLGGRLELRQVRLLGAESVAGYFGIQDDDFAVSLLLRRASTFFNVFTLPGMFGNSSADLSNRFDGGQRA